MAKSKGSGIMLRSMNCTLTKFEGPCILMLMYSCKPSVPSGSTENIGCVSVIIPSKINHICLYMLLDDTTLSLYDTIRVDCVFDDTYNHANDYFPRSSRCLLPRQGVTFIGNVPTLLTTWIMAEGKFANTLNYPLKKRNWIMRSCY